MHMPPRGPAPNYTVPALIMGFVNLLAWLIVIWGVWGFSVALLVGVALHWLVGRLPHRD
ncbi:hypothetical protein [Actibacterium mucosum]|uniref:hypothetical protein n=1 Tax=Actibacterium mucosum TaxID=1087332 RepID=UPI00146F9A4C|nr:hypothetical protein [Actibacterium mucosum]